MDFDVYLFEKPCGILSIENERFTFTYLPEYIDPQSTPLSVLMPVRNEAYEDSTVFPFFENLLPEGQIRKLLAERLKTSETNYSRILERIGGDVAGAITVLPKGNQIDEVGIDFDAKKLTNIGLGKLLGKIVKTPMLAEPEGKLRLSLAGAQNKLPIIYDGKNVFVTNGNPSTHIVKPPSPRFPYLVENEYLCMRLARRVGIDTPVVFLVPYTGSDKTNADCYVIERYDRRQTGNGVQRLHQEDLCQIHKIASASKYEKDGGPGYAELFASLKELTVPAAVHQNQAIRRILFSLVIGNNDAHGKNFSFLHGKTLQLAPAYDLVCTAIYEDLDSHFAMKFGSASEIRELDREALTQFEEQCGVSLRRQSRDLAKFTDSILKNLKDEIAALKKNSYPDIDEFLDRMLKIATKKHKFVNRLLK